MTKQEKRDILAIRGQYVPFAYRGDVMEPASLNLYVYCANDPVNFWDPSGHDAESNINSA